MDKNNIINFIKQSIDSGAISKEDVAHVLYEYQENIENVDINANDVSETPGIIQKTSNNLINLLYGIGGLIVIIGVIILVAQNWLEIGSAGRIFVTFGISLLSYIVAYLVSSRQNYQISQVFFTVSAVLAPFGVSVLLNELSIEITAMSQILIVVVFVILYGIALLITKKDILVLIVAGFFTWAYYLILLEFFPHIRINEDTLKLATIILGIFYLALSRAYQNILRHFLHSPAREQKVVQNILYGAGAIAILGTSITIGGIFDLLMIALIFGVFYLSIYIKSSFILIIGAFFLIAHIIKLTSKYFAGFISWPIALIGIGVFIIVTGYLTYYINKEYIKR